MAHATVRIEVQFLLTVPVTDEQFEALQGGPRTRPWPEQVGAYAEAYEAACVAAEKAYDEGEVGIQDGMRILDVRPW